MGKIEVICGECKNKSVYDADYVSEKGLPKTCPKCGKEYDIKVSV